MSDEPGGEGFVLPIEDFIDLHPFRPRDIRSVVESYLEAAAHEGFTEVRLIHGRGIGVQRDAVRKVLEKNDRVIDFRDAPAERGGWGATIARLTPTAGRSHNDSMADRIDIVCPCCETRLVADTETGEILSEERPKKDLGKSFSDAMGQVRSGASRREAAFSKAVERNEKLGSLLDKKFEEARKKAKENPDEKPLNPLDYD